MRLWDIEHETVIKKEQEMKIAENRGRNMVEVRERNTKEIKSYYKANPGATQAEVAEAVGVTVKTVGRVVKQLKTQGR